MVKLAWRNIWRNRSRSIITIAAVGFSVFFALFMRSFQLGTYQNMIDEVMGSYFGYIQVHGKGYWDEQTLENSFEDSDSLRLMFTRQDGVENAIGRLEAFSLVSNGNITRGGLIMGIDPTNELKGLQLEERVTDGQFLDPNEHSVVVGKELAEYLKVGAGDTLFFIGQGYHAQSAYGRYPIRGVVNLRNPSLNRTLVMMPLAEAQWMFACPGRLTTYALDVEKTANYKQIAKTFSNNNQINSDLEVMTWEELFPDVIQGILADNAGGLIIILVLYVIIAFVLLGTVIMMTGERMIEFGILISVGMQRWYLAVITVLENAFLAFIGGIAGVALGYPIVIFFNRNPIRLDAEMGSAIEQYGYEAVMPTTTDPTIALTHSTFVISIAILMSFYAVNKIMKLKPVEAIRS